MCLCIVQSEGSVGYKLKCVCVFVQSEGSVGYKLKCVCLCVCSERGEHGSQAEARPQLQEEG